MANEKNQYSSARDFMTNKPTWVSDTYDQDRLGAYALYEDLYRNSPDTTRLMLRGSDDKPIYIPTAKGLIKTLARYVAKGWKYQLAPANPDPNYVPTPEEIAEAALAYDTLFKRERFMSMFQQNKTKGLYKGDWLFYIYADPEKPEGRRISIRTLDPGTYFPIESEDDPTQIIGCDIVEQWVVGSDTYIKRQRFLKNTHPDHPAFENYEAPIARQVEFLELQNWETEPKPVTGPAFEALPLEELPGIFNLPVYHIKNNEDPDLPFGTSDLAGLESVIAGINQAFSDQDQALAMAGLGMYATDGGAPVDDQGQETDWLLGPGRVVEVGDGKKFTRVSGVPTVDPSKTHIEMLESRAHRTLGINDVALGTADAQVAESGIALKIRMAPLIDEAEARDDTIKEVMDNFLWDLRDWFREYESVDIANLTAVSVFGDKLPANTEKELDFLHKLYLDQVIDVFTYHDMLREKGIPIPVGSGNAIEDADSDRIEQEAGNEEPPEDGDDEGLSGLE